jgi:hypothetical protein
VKRRNLKKLSELEDRKQYQIEISNTFAALENLNDSESINRTSDNIKENVKISVKETLGLYGWKQNKLCFDKACSQFLCQRKQAKLQWLQDTNQSNFNNLNNARCEAARHFRNKKREYLTARINELEPNSKYKNISELYREIGDIWKGYQPRTNIVNDEKGDLVADCHSILARSRNYFSQLLNVHGDNDVKQTEIHTAEPLVPEPSAFEVQMATEKLKRYKSSGIDQIPAELVEAGGSEICSEIHTLMNSIWKKEELPEHWKE